jgi:hypothetical protein
MLVSSAAGLHLAGHGEPTPSVADTTTTTTAATAKDDRMVALENKIAALEAENATLKGRSTGQGTGTLDIIDREFSLAQALHCSDSKLELLEQMTSAELTKHVQTAIASHISRQLFEGLHTDIERVEGGVVSESESPRGKHKVTSRSKFRQTLDGVIGPQPKVKELWKKQHKWEELVSDMTNISYNESYSEHVTKHPHWATAATFIAKQQETGSLQRTLDSGYSREESEALCLLNSHGIKAALQRAAAENSARYASMTHAVYNSIAHRAALGEVAPKCFMNLTGKGGLSETDALWADILTPDDTGFRGLTSFAALKLV